MTRLIRLATSACLLAGCASSGPDDTTEDTGDLAIHHHIDSADGASILATSLDRRWVAYGTACDQGLQAATIKLYDELTEETTVLAHDVSCLPGSVTFSPDGALVAFGDGTGHVQVHDSITERTISVSRSGESSIGIVFSPDSQWFVVASAEGAPLAATLEAWDADLQTHVEIAQHAFWNPFALGPLNVQMSDDSSELLFLGQLSTGFPVGTLSRWSHADQRATAIASGVLAGAYVVRRDWQYVAYLAGATVPPPPSGPVGNLVISDLVTGHAQVAALATPAVPLGFANDTLVYGVHGALAGEPLTLFAFDRTTATTTFVDAGVFAGNGTNAIAVSPAGDAIAYTRNFDPFHVTAELRVARIAQLAAPRTIALHAIPRGTYGWIDSGNALVFLHDPTSTMPGATLGTLSAWHATSGHTDDLATGVPQIGLAFDPGATDLVFTSSYDVALAAGDLQVWNSNTGDQRMLGHRAAVMSAQRSPDMTFAAFLHLIPASTGLPTVKLQASFVVGPPRVINVASKVTSLSVGWFGRIVYTTPSGVYDAIVL